MLEYLARIWPLGACRAALTSVFDQADTRTNVAQPLAKRVDSALSNMVRSGTLSSRGDGADREWTLSEAAQLEAAKDAPARGKPAAPYVGVIVPPRKPAVMTDQAYRPRPMQALRAGSNDFANCPSLHQGQRLPFTGGYVVMADGSKS
jgi:hypothetical protein